MRYDKIALAALLPALLVGLGAAAQAAGTLVVSGDENITNALVGNDTAVNPGDQTFFANVLDGGTRVLVQGTDVSIADAPVANTNTFYNTLSGVTSTIQSGPVTTASLSGVNLFVSAIPANAFSPSEIAALSTFSMNGGTIFLLGDAASFVPVADANLEALLVGLGSSLTLVPDNLDPGYQAATGSHIATGNPLTAGVNSFTYAFVSQVTGGTSLFTTTGGQTFLAAENIKVAAVPEPGSIALLLGMGLTGAGLLLKKRRR